MQLALGQILAVLLSLLPTAVLAAPGARVTVWWKPMSVDTIASDVAGMKAQLAATDLIIYCGYAAMPDGSFGVDPNPEGSWGDIALCKPAVTAAKGAGLGVQLIVEGRMDGNVGAALKVGGRVFGRTAAVALAAAYPVGSVNGINLDWEPGHNKTGNIKPSQQEIDAFNAAFGAALAPQQTLSACVAQWTPYTANFSRALSAGGLSAVYDMGLYHGLSSSEWSGKLADALHNAGGSSSELAVGFALAPKYAWENTTASVVDRFAALKSSGVRHVAVFAWAAGGLSGVKLPPSVLAEWTSQLQQFTSLAL